MALKKIINSIGQKAFQRGDDHEDREWQYKNWLRSFKVDGFFTDIDMFKWKLIDGKATITAITDLTRTDKKEVSQHYLDSIFYRVFHRDTQGRNLEHAGEMLNVPVFLVLFPKEVDWMWVLHFSDRQWKKYTCEEWAEFLKDL